MSDLCHNCGDCHLGAQPLPCGRQLSHCNICKNYGHQYNFCPLSVLKVDKAYQYWMLCHNCDSWHLPKPCTTPLVTCARCHIKGHLAHFCPIDPLVRAPPLGPGAGNKRQRGDVHEEADRPHMVPVPIIDPGLIDQDLLKRLKADVAIETYELLKSYRPADVFYYVSGGLIQQPPPSVFQNNQQVAPPNFNHDGMSIMAPPAVQHAFGVPYAANLLQQQTTMVTPAPSSTVKPMSDLPAATQAQVYTTMQERFERGELVKSSDSPVALQHANVAPPQEPIEQDEDGGAGDSMQENAHPAATPKDKVKATPASRRRKTPTPNTRCEECKRRHRRCSHMQDGPSTEGPEEEEDTKLSTDIEEGEKESLIGVQGKQNVADRLLQAQERRNSEQQAMLESNLASMPPMFGSNSQLHNTDHPDQLYEEQHYTMPLPGHSQRATDPQMAYISNLYESPYMQAMPHSEPLAPSTDASLTQLLAASATDNNQGANHMQYLNHESNESNNFFQSGSTDQTVMEGQQHIEQVQYVQAELPAQATTEAETPAAEPKKKRGGRRKRKT